MKYERINRSLEETIEFLKKNDWCISTYERDLLFNEMTIKGYLDMYTGDKAQKFVNFFFKKVEEFEEGQWCWFWDDEFDEGDMGIYKSYNQKTDNHISSRGCYKNCIPIEEFRERLKEYL